MTNNTENLNRMEQESGISIPSDINEETAKDVSEEASNPKAFLEIQKDTMQVPFRTASMLDRLMNGSETAFDAAVYQCYNASSGWDTGISHSLSIRKAANRLGVSHQYVQQATQRLCENSWFERLSGPHKINKFELKHHLCEPDDIPYDRNGRPAKCAMPRGEGGLFDRLESKDIHWKSMLIWMLMKVNSDFTTGITEPISIKKLREWTRFGNTTICDCIKELEAAGMLEKLERRPQEAQTYQLYPKPYEERKERAPETFRTWRSMRAVGDWRYSFNEKWRVNLETLHIQYRPNGRTPFRSTSDYEKYFVMPKRIREDFDSAVLFHAQLPDDLKRRPRSR